MSLINVIGLSSLLSSGALGLEMVVKVDRM